MTALWFEHLRAADRVSVKPHASPVLHAIEYLLGQLDRQPPDHAARVRWPAELSEPAEGSGARRLLHRLGRDRRDRDPLERARPPVRRRPLRGPTGRTPHRAPGRRRARRRRVLGGDRRPGRPHLGEVLWIVDLNRQSLDRVVPEIAADRLGAMFEAAGWKTITVKYGRWLRECSTARAAPHCAHGSTR